MTRSKSRFIEKLLFSIAWPISSTKKSHIKTSKNSFLVKFLHAMSYSQHNISIKPDTSSIDAELESAIHQVDKLWHKAQKATNEGRLIIARNTLNKIIEIDKFNAAAYNRLGIIYAKRYEYELSISNFKIAAGLDNSASSNHNLGLIYYETQQYKKSLKYFKKALNLEDSLAARHIAIAKVYDKLGKEQKMISHLKTAYELEPSPSVMKLLYIAYMENNAPEEANKLELKMKNKLKKVEREIKNRPLKKSDTQPNLPSVGDLEPGYLYG